MLSNPSSDCFSLLVDKLRELCPKVIIGIKDPAFAAFIYCSAFRLLTVASVSRKMLKLCVNSSTFKKFLFSFALRLINADFSSSTLDKSMDLTQVMRKQITAIIYF